jgi:hypothetical protein
MFQGKSMIRSIYPHFISNFQQPREQFWTCRSFKQTATKPSIHPKEGTLQRKKSWMGLIRCAGRFSEATTTLLCAFTIIFYYNKNRHPNTFMLLWKYFPRQLNEYGLQIYKYYKVIYDQRFKRLSLTLPKMLSTCNLEGVGVEHLSMEILISSS